MNYIFTEIEFATPEHSESVVLRDLVLRKPLKLEFTEDQMAKEWDQMHFVAMNNEQSIVAVLLMKPLSETVVKMRQVAVHPDLQGAGIGSQLVEFVERDMLKRGYAKIELHARDVAIPFYEKRQYSKVGEEFVEVNIPHYKMEKSL